MSLPEATSLDSDEMLFVSYKPAPESTGRCTILLAEDNDDLRIVMKFLLVSMGYQVVACADGRIALTAFRDHSGIDLLMTDLEMPNMSGLELAREVTTDRPTLPVVLVTGSILTVANVKELVDRGWTYMSKPIEVAALRRTLQRLSGRNLRIGPLDKSMGALKNICTA